ncbi:MULTISPECIES: hypothetical protein [unclassified Streptosporangium]|uniref:hypothetical protein n=1 Tax=unclassified Streptosporangium TaxID=2632669 RepID=UPI002E2B1AED|nr:MULTISPECIES: hypothetical protein [unclassified Streptosporangium]
MDITPEEAARTLDQVHETRRRVLRAAPPMFPAWYPVAVWGFVTGIQFVTEIPSFRWLWVAVVALSACLAVAVLKFVKDVRNASLRPHPSVMDPWAWIGFTGWLVATGLGSALLALWLKDLDLAYPRTLMGVIMTVIVAITSPLLARWMSGRTARRAETAKR